ncbi:AraC family transcriptional regulator [Aureimonas sp. Leaf454]|uniref:AraC family transcriptional regulator n=1 Tax=Aureimonas sp. Leaf454 TaxID=1736381 RepID=UPI0009EACC22|nr:AraC family transcriptional regulator [Aureimonas sp. Leaf454]
MVGLLDKYLAGSNLVDTRSPEDAREQIGRIFCPHFLLPSAARPAGFHARHRSVSQNRYSVNIVSYGDEVEIDPGELGSFFLLQIPVQGEARVRCGASTVESQAGRTATLLSPTLPTRMTWFEGCEQLIVLLERSALEAHCANLVGLDLGPLEFEAAIDLQGPVGAAIERHARLMLECADRSSAVGDIYLGMLRDGLASLLVTGLRNSASDQFARRSDVSAPSTVRAAEAWLEANAGRSFAMADLAAAVGVSLRSLQDGFRRHRGVTISESLQSMRLLRFRAELLRAAPFSSVASLAFSSGLTHLGRAAADYRKLYGESPSETLKGGIATSRRPTPLGAAVPVPATLSGLRG